MRRPLLLLFSLMLAISSCREEDIRKYVDPDTSGNNEQAETDAVYREIMEAHEKLEAGDLKSEFDTTNLEAETEYIVLFKSSFQKPLAEVYAGPASGRESAAIAHGRDVQERIGLLFPETILPQIKIQEWFSILSSGFSAVLTPIQIKSIYQNEHVKCIFKNGPVYDPEAPKFSENKTEGLFIHGFKEAAVGNTRKIWVNDTQTLISDDTYYNIDFVYSKDFNSTSSPSISGHGTTVAFVAAGKQQTLNNFRGTASNANVVVINSNMSWKNINKSLEYIWKFSNPGDILNFSLGALEDGNSPPVLEMENNILDFKTNDIAVVIAAGNDSKPAHVRSPARLGVLYRQDSTQFRFLWVATAIDAVGTEEQIKNATCSFKLSGYANWGPAVRVALIGSWQTPNGGSIDGTSYAAPALSGILFHNENPLHHPKYLPQDVTFTKGDYTYKYKIPTLR